PRRVEEVSLAKSGLLDEIKDETSEDGCSSGRSDLEVDQEASSLEPGHGVVCCPPPQLNQPMRSFCFATSSLSSMNPSFYVTEHSWWADTK
ncbi:unnamed protein product, partial [Brassica oleracea]